MIECHRRSRLSNFEVFADAYKVINGRGGGGSNPDEAYSFSVKFVLERMKINKKWPGSAHLLRLQISNQ